LFWTETKKAIHISCTFEYHDRFWEHRFMAFRYKHQFTLITHGILVFISVVIASTGFAQTKKVNAGANAHSKATTLTHPSAKIPITEPPSADKPSDGVKTTATSGAAAPESVSLQAPSLSWNDAVKLARLQNADLHAAQATIDQYNAAVKGAWGSFLPTITATLGIQKSNTADQADADSDTARLNLSENLFNGFGDHARLEQARKQRESFQAAYDLTQAQVTAQLKTSFQNLLVSELNVKLSDDIILRRQTNLDLVTLRFEGGRENKGSVLLSQANLDQAKLERLTAANAVESARVTLAKVIGEEKLPYGDVSSSVPVSVPPLQVNFEALALGAPELRQAVAAEQAASEGIKVARSGFFPSLDLTASVGRFGSSFFPQTDQGVVSLGLTIPLFSGGKTYYGVQAAQAVETNASYLRQSALRSKIVDLRNAYNMYIEAVEQERVAQSFVTAAETRAEIARSQYNTGLINFQNWDLIESDLVTRQRSALSSQTNRVAAEAAWDQSQGQGLFK
jgi:outer membrane protein